MERAEHWCTDPARFPVHKLFQTGSGRGARLLLVGLAPAARGWRLSGRAFFTPDGRLLPSGRNLNALLQPLGLALDECAFTDLVKCYFGPRPRAAQLAACARGCWPIFERQVQRSDARLLLLLGVATARLFGELTGTPLSLGDLGSVQIAHRTYTVLPLYHPSPANPFSQARNTVLMARRARRIARVLAETAKAAVP